MGTIWELARRAAASFVGGYILPKFLIASGVPIDEWAKASGAWVHITMTTEQAFWTVSLIVAVVLFVISGYWPEMKAWIMSRWSRSSHEAAVTDGIGGKGGDAKVSGSGAALGGPGGRGGRIGRGGPGGSAHVLGDGIAAGGAGGAAGENGVWRAPARSGYEVYMRNAGLPVDPFLAKFGRGGTSPEYFRKLDVIKQIRAEFVRCSAHTSEDDLENVNLVPLDYLNQQLESRSQNWRVRIVDDQYEFYATRV